MLVCFFIATNAYAEPGPARVTMEHDFNASMNASWRILGRFCAISEWQSLVRSCAIEERKDGIYRVVVIGFLLY